MAKKNIQMNIRVSEEAKNRITENAKNLGISQSDYIEKIANEGCLVFEVKNDNYIEYAKQQESALAKIGSNLNQITAGINAGRINSLDKNIETFFTAKFAFEKLYLKLTECEERIEVKTTTKREE